MNKRLISKNLLKIAKDLIAKESIDQESPEYEKYQRFRDQVRKKFSKFGTSITTSIDKKDIVFDPYPVATINISATGNLQGDELDDFISEFNKAVVYIKSKEKEAIRLFNAIPKK